VLIFIAAPSNVTECKLAPVSVIRAMAVSRRLLLSVPDKPLIKK